MTDRQQKIIEKLAETIEHKIDRDNAGNYRANDDHSVDVLLNNIFALSQLSNMECKVLIAFIKRLAKLVDEPRCKADFESEENAAIENAMFNLFKKIRNIEIPYDEDGCDMTDY